MKNFSFFIRKIFLRRWILIVTIIPFLFVANYLVFIVARSFMSTVQGYQEMQKLNQEGTYIGREDADHMINFDIVTNEKMHDIYTYLDNHFRYGLYSDGTIASISNRYGIEVSLNYINEALYQQNLFGISDGVDLSFDYSIKDKIPVLVGEGLRRDYPIGTEIRLKEPSLKRDVIFTVCGVLKKNTSHSNFYTLSSKKYYNFSILVPVNKEFIQKAQRGFGVNAIMNLVIFDSTREKLEKFNELIQKNLEARFKFSTQDENYEFFNYYVASLEIIFSIIFVILIVVVALSIWNTLASIRLMIKDFSIHLFVGLSYSRLRFMLYGYIGLLLFVSWVAVFLCTVADRYRAWAEKITFFITYGVFGLIGMDWLALLVTMGFDIALAVMIVELMMRKIKKIPISLGVMQ